MVYRAILDGDVTTVSSPAVAEMEKILENTYRNINIGLVNELAILCDRMGIAIWEVIDAAKTKPYGFQAFYPGPGLGGHCIPLDPYYLSWKAREYGFHTSMIEASMMVNDRMPGYTVRFRKTGAAVDFYDPYVPKYRDAGVWYTGIPALTPEAVGGYDLVCIATAHTTVDYAMVASCGVPVFDCKNVCKHLPHRENIEVL